MKPEIKLYNTLTRQVETFEPLDPEGDVVTMYVCGPTVYDEAHLGHARCYITWDVLYRFLGFAGYDVRYTRNITDVDDKILNRARENGESPTQLAERNTARFHEVMARLNTLSPTEEPKATAFVVPQMVEFIRVLIEKGHAYVTPSGTVYYDVNSDKNYSDPVRNLCHQDLDELQSGSRVDVDPEKRNPLDFALWKPAPKDEPLVWDATWPDGKPGRPGWHIECSAMSKALLGDQLDIHAGGMDLIFPHHQNEIAQSEAYTGKRFVKYWMHNGFVNVSGEKMSKSLGNFSTVDKLLESYDANTLRYFILTNHYRMPMDFNDEALEGASNRIKKMSTGIQSFIRDNRLTAADLDLDRAALQVRNAMGASRDGSTQMPKSWDEELLLWAEAMANDLNTAQALSRLNALYIVATNPTTPGTESIEAFQVFLVLARVMGFDFLSAATDDQVETIQAELIDLYLEIIQLKEISLKTIKIDSGWPASNIIETIIDARKQVREAKAWAISDIIRDRLLNLGVYLKDGKEGTTWYYERASSPATP